MKGDGPYSSPSNDIHRRGAPIAAPTLTRSERIKSWGPAAGGYTAAGLMLLGAIGWAVSSWVVAPQLGELESRLDERIDRVERALDETIEALDDHVDERMDALDRQLASLRAAVEALHRSVEALDRRMAVDSTDTEDRTAVE